jgi:hypothetical protein
MVFVAFTGVTSLWLEFLVCRVERREGRKIAPVRASKMILMRRGVRVMLLRGSTAKL